MSGTGFHDQKNNALLLDYARQGDGFHHTLRAHLERAKGTLDLDARVAGSGDTALMLAVATNSPLNLAALLKAGASPDAPDNQGVTPLMRALSLGHAALARELLLAGASPMFKSEAGLDAAAIAAQSAVPAVQALLPWLDGRAEAATLLAQRAQEEKNRAVITAAKESTRREDIESALAAGGDVNAVDRQGNSALMWAATRNHAAGIELLLEKGAAIDYQNMPGKDYTALISAAKHGNHAAIAALLKAGADTQVKTEGGKTAFEVAMQNGHAGSAFMIADAELRRAKTEDDKKAAATRRATARLVQAVDADDPSRAVVALSEGPDLNAEVTQGYSILTRALAERDDVFAWLLVDAGAALDRPDARGRLPLPLARDAGFDDIALKIEKLRATSTPKIRANTPPTP
jgi:ankyrin repeat protein